ncbi:transmembrane protein, putative (macronuclear) [Tetrahymena thermophila SB210]|uniref:Transmembrane protein, putative n=1 Tax=Tetrahymena thermophila (strain SB210) TaxID=312017 RepID=W7X2W1_TETTS|nr:transmembrane protein, putative [Tetrahymena thermophila SB210]EWS73650.1 transmembrane protein, putative [Tetrahymena thermophila SB210]|eukprot:XP_012653780.1 transmembrane protein, putative [Tetrahymena thermophila SB210]
MQQQISYYRELQDFISQNNSNEKAINLNLKFKNINDESIEKLSSTLKQNLQLTTLILDLQQKTTIYFIKTKQINQFLIIFLLEKIFYVFQIICFNLNQLKKKFFQYLQQANKQTPYEFFKSNYLKLTPDLLIKNKFKKKY